MILGMTRTIFLALAFFIAGALLLPAAAQEGGSAKGPADGSVQARHVCPMGEYEGDKPGNCPKCGMTLVKKK